MLSNFQFKKIRHVFLVKYTQVIIANIVPEQIKNGWTLYLVFVYWDYANSKMIRSNKFGGLPYQNC